MITSSRLILREMIATDAPFILELLNDGDFYRYIGDRGIRTLEQVDIGYAFLPQYRGQGYAIEAAQAALADGKSRLGIGQVVAIVTPGNERSIGLLAKLGLVRSRLVKLSEDADECLLLEQ
ncbi:GNAT family N-acetyltransferase [Aeromonas veronii]|uniref:GNAT family N-acetyltransferase n=1 Tax=Aeromonas veronii TaxID=654 RepID=UPI003BA3DF14